MIGYDSQIMLMGRLLNVPEDCAKAINAGVRRDDWQSEDLRDCWDAIVRCARRGGFHSLVGICESVDDQQIQNKIVEFFDLLTRSWFTTLDLAWQLERAFGRSFNV